MRSKYQQFLKDKIKAFAREHRLQTNLEALDFSRTQTEQNFLSLVQEQDGSDIRRVRSYTNPRNNSKSRSINKLPVVIESKKSN